MSKFLKINKVFLLIREFFLRSDQEKIMKEASNLTFVSVLGFVPFLLFIVFLLPEIPSLNIQDLLKKYILSTFLPESADLITQYVNELLSNTVQMNILNILMLLITSYSLFSSISHSFDKILKIENQQNFSILNFSLKFLGTIIFGFMIILLLFSMSSLPFISFLFDQNFIKLLIIKFIPFIIWVSFIFFIYYFIPSKRYKPKNILISSIYTAVVWSILKNGFDWYITHMTKMKVFYGVIASFPIFLFWIYANWIIVLSGIVFLSILNKTEIKRKVKVEHSIKITIEDEKELFLTEETSLNNEQSNELIKIIKEKIK